MKSPHRFQFGNVVVDELRHELTVGGLVQNIELRPLQLLILLLRQPGNLVRHEQIRQEAWQGRLTTPNAIHNSVNKIRKALGPQNKNLIVSKSKLGYQFDGDVFATPLIEKSGGWNAPDIGRNTVINLEKGLEVAATPLAQLFERLSGADGDEVWSLRFPNSSELQNRVCKFATDADRITALKREVTVSSLLQLEGESQSPFIQVLNWRFDEPPYCVEFEDGGLDLLDWSAKNADRLRGMDENERLVLFLDVAGALATAHNRGVVHGDPKPKNVLVDDQGGRLRIRLTDFGSARWFDEGADAGGRISAQGYMSTQDLQQSPQLATFAYLAPERRDAMGPATIQSDVYALGILLYQCVVGDFRRAWVPGWEKDVPDPLLRADVARATDADPQQRYPNVSALLADLLALPARRAAAIKAAAEQQAREQAERLAERARLRRPLLRGLWGLGLLLVMVLAAFAYRSWQANRELAQQFRAVETLARFLEEDFVRLADPAVSGSRGMTVEQAARLAAGRIERRFGQESPSVRFRLHQAVAASLAAVEEHGLAAKEGAKALEIARQVQIDDPSAPMTERLNDLRLQQAWSLRTLNEAGPAVDLLQQVEASGKLPAAQEVLLWNTHGALAGDRQDFKAALQHNQRAWRVIQARRVTGSDVPFALEDRVAFALADEERLVGDLSASEARLRALMRSQQEHYGELDWRACRTGVLLADTLTRAGRLAEVPDVLIPARECLARALGKDSGRVGIAWKAWGAFLNESKRYAEAAAAREKAWQVLAPVVGEQAVVVLSEQLGQLESLRFAGMAQLCEAQAEQRLFRFRQHLGPDHLATQELRYWLAGCRLDQGRALGVSALLDGLEAARFSEGEPHIAWAARLAFERARLAHFQARTSKARTLIQEAEAGLSGKQPDPVVNPGTLGQWKRVLVAKRNAPT